MIDKKINFLAYSGHKNIINIFIYIVQLFICFAASASELLINDNFDNGKWSEFWGTERPFNYSINIIKDFEKEGGIARFEWRKSDIDDTRKTKGTELKTISFPGSPPLEIGFRFFLDVDTQQNSDKPLILMQIHSVPDFDKGEQWRNPISTLTYRNGELYYDYRSSKEVVTKSINNKWVYDNEGKIILPKLKIGVWNQILIQQRFDYTDKLTGSINIIFNGENFSANNINVGFNDRKGPTFKFGIYCPRSFDSEKVIVYFDDVKLSKLH